jgi:hypothetical protein
MQLHLNLAAAHRGQRIKALLLLIPLQDTRRVADTRRWRLAAGGPLPVTAPLRKATGQMVRQQQLNSTKATQTSLLHRQLSSGRNLSVSHA